MNKRLIVINGTMGVGKTTTCRALRPLLPSHVFLDGDWCWDLHPFQVTEETREMVLENIAFLLNQFLRCTACQDVLFCWVLPREEILQNLLARLEGTFSLQWFTLDCGREELIRRLQQDIQGGLRDPGVVERALDRMEGYGEMPSIHVDVTHRSPQEVARWIWEQLQE